MLDRLPVEGITLAARANVIPLPLKRVVLLHVAAAMNDPENENAAPIGAACAIASLKLKVVGHDC